MKGHHLSILSAGMLLGLAGCASTGGEVPPTGEQLGDVPAHAETTYTVTGSRIRHRKDGDGQPELYTSYPLTVFGREELDMTGERDLGAALRMLYPGLY
jgi:hypothetical protein